MISIIPFSILNLFADDTMLFNSSLTLKSLCKRINIGLKCLVNWLNTNLISLTSELKFAKAYIHVQSERFGDNLQLNWNIPEATEEKLIAPMSLQLLLENAIKHNVVSRAKPLVINVDASDDFIVVKNKIQRKSTQLPSTKMGLKNIEKRYALISDRTVEIVNDDRQFSVTLPLLDKSSLNE